MYRRNLVLTCSLTFAGVVFPHCASAINVADFADYSLRAANNQVLLPGRLYTPPRAQPFNMRCRGHSS